MGAMCYHLRCMCYHVAGQVLPFWWPHVSNLVAKRYSVGGHALPFWVWPCVLLRRPREDKRHLPSRGLWSNAAVLPHICRWRVWRGACAPKSRLCGVLLAIMPCERAQKVGSSASGLVASIAMHGLTQSTTDTTTSVDHAENY